MPIMHAWHHQDYIAAAGALIQAAIGALAAWYIFRQQTIRSKQDNERIEANDRILNRSHLIEYFNALAGELVFIYDSCPERGPSEYKTWQSKVFHHRARMRDLSGEVKKLFSQEKAKLYIERFAEFEKEISGLVKEATPRILPKAKEISDLMQSWCE